MEKTGQMIEFEEETGEYAIVTVKVGFAELQFPSEVYVEWLEAELLKASVNTTAYDRLMSGGKKTPKEVANFLGKPIALDSIRGIARWFWYDEVPTFVSDPEFQFCGWTSTKRLNELPADIIEYHGDWEGSLTLPDGWEEK